MIGQQLKETLNQLAPTKSSQDLTVTELYEEIELTADEVQEALRVAREHKYFMQQREIYRQKLIAQPVYKRYTSSELFDFAFKSFEIDQDNNKIIIELCKYFAGDESFVGDLNKGLLIAGPVGSGKSFLMEAFKSNQRFSYRVVKCRDVENKFSEKRDKDEEMDPLGYWSYNNDLSTPDAFGQVITGFCFDDLGTEERGMHYGRAKNVMAEVILNRYDNKLPFNSTHITTNKSVSEIEQLYGTRVVDRMFEMFNIVAFEPTAKSRRK